MVSTKTADAYITLSRGKHLQNHRKIAHVSTLPILFPLLYKIVRMLQNSRNKKESHQGFSAKHNTINYSQALLCRASNGRRSHFLNLFRLTITKHFVQMSPPNMLYSLCLNTGSMLTRCISLLISLIILSILSLIISFIICSCCAKPPIATHLSRQVASCAAKHRNIIILIGYVYARMYQNQSNVKPIISLAAKYCYYPCLYQRCFTVIYINSI